MSGTSNYPTLLDIAILNNSDATVGIIDEASRAVPEVRLGYARPIDGISYKTAVRTSLPSAPFRMPNAGTAVGKSTYENRTVECFFLNPRWECDKALADTYQFGAEEYIATEGQSLLEAGLQTLGRQFFYGRNQWTVSGTTYGGDPNGFPGLIDGYNTAYEVDAQGTTANTASSVWGVKWGPRNVSWAYGNEGQMTISEVLLQRVTDSNGNAFTAYCQELEARPGLQIGDLRGVIRIKNITQDTGHTMTDAMLYNAMALVTSNIMPDMWFMNRQTLAQLRQSRTAVNPLGTPAPIPTDLEGIPIFVTDSLTTTEPINFLSK